MSNRSTKGIHRPERQNGKVLAYSHWKAEHPERGYTQSARVLDGDIIHLAVEGKGNLVMDEMDYSLLMMVTRESGVAETGQKHIVIVGIEPVTDFTLRYRHAISDLIFNTPPGFRLIVFYGVQESMTTLIASFNALVPDELLVLTARNFDEALEAARAFKNGKIPQKSELAEQLDEHETAVNAFLAMTARMSWMNMLEQHIPVTSFSERYQPFFKAIRTMQADLKAREQEKELEVQQLKQDLEHRITRMGIKMNAQSELNKKATRDYEKEIAELKTRIATQDMELTRVSTAIAEKTTTLRDLLDKIHALSIETDQKRQMTDLCLSLIETETIEKRLNIELTESDSVFLSKLQKRHPNLNQRELRIALLVKLNYDTREIARSIGISTRGMESIRYRMHKKLGLGKHQSIKTYLSDLAASF